MFGGNLRNIAIWGIPFCFRPAKFHKTGPRQDGHNAPQQIINLGSNLGPRRVRTKGRIGIAVADTTLGGRTQILRIKRRGASETITNTHNWILAVFLRVGGNGRGNPHPRNSKTIDLENRCQLGHPCGTLTGRLRDRYGLV